MILIAESECAVVESQGHLGNMGLEETPQKLSYALVGATKCSLLKNFGNFQSGALNIAKSLTGVLVNHSFR
jgi:hypothetical protein